MGHAHALSLGPRHGPSHQLHLFRAAGQVRRRHHLEDRTADEDFPEDQRHPPDLPGLFQQQTILRWFQARLPQNTLEHAAAKVV